MLYRWLSQEFVDKTMNIEFSLTWPASIQVIQIYGNKKDFTEKIKEFNSHRIGLEHQDVLFDVM